MSFFKKYAHLCPFPITPELCNWPGCLRLRSKSNFFLMPIKTNFIMASCCAWDVNQLWIMILITPNLNWRLQTMHRCINQYLNVTSVDGYGFVSASCELVSSESDYMMWSCVCIWGHIKQMIQLQVVNLMETCRSINHVRSSYIADGGRIEYSRAVKDAMYVLWEKILVFKVSWF